MKVGMIFECGPAGADKAVCVSLARLLKPDIAIQSVTLDNKPGLIKECGVAAAQLFSDGCRRVVIVWDLYPPWRESGAKPCRREDRMAIDKALRKAGLKGNPSIWSASNKSWKPGSSRMDEPYPRSCLDHLIRCRLPT